MKANSRFRKIAISFSIIISILILLLFFSRNIILDLLLPVSGRELNTMINKAVYLARKIDDEEIRNGESKYHKEQIEIIEKLIDLGMQNATYKEFYKYVLLNDNDVAKIGLAVIVLNRLGEETVPDRLLALLNNSDPKIRATAILYLGDIKKDSIKMRIEEVSKTDPDSKVRNIAEHVLATWEKEDDGDVWSTYTDHISSVEREPNKLQ